MFVNAGDTQRLIGYGLWSCELPQDLANAQDKMLTAAREKAAINCKINNCKVNNSNFELLDETKDLHAPPTSIARMKKHKEHKTLQCAYTFSRLPRGF